MATEFTLPVTDMVHVPLSMKELDELDKQKALNQLLTKLQEAEKSIITEGTISADELEKGLGVL